MHRPADKPDLFQIGFLRAMELGEADIPALQQFFEANPGYFIAVTGEPPRPDEAHCEFLDALPAGWPFTRRWLIGFMDPGGVMIGMAGVVSDLLAEHVWHIGLFVVASSLQGSGTARALHEQLESWMRGQGARWIRLGVVEGNARAERFWEKAGYVEVRKRAGVEMGSLVNTLRIMVKLPAGGGVPDYLARVARDRPE